MIRTQNTLTEGVILSYRGNLTRELFGDLIQLAEVKLEILEDNCKLKKKVFNVLVELLQNMYHHFEEPAVEGRFLNVCFSLRKIKNDYLIVTGNPVSLKNAKKLREKIDCINSMSPSEIKLQYRKNLSDRVFSSKGGAGLGLMSMVRKSGAKVDYKFRSFNNDFSFFNLKVKVSA